MRIRTYFKWLGKITLILFCLPGMVDIARQTVEFLYEENGGIPRDLYLPTIEDIKDEANKFTIDKVRKGKVSKKYLEGKITATGLALVLGIYC